MATDNNSSKRRIHYTPNTDILFLTEVLAKNPWASKNGWVELAVYMRTKPGFLGVEAKSLRERAALLLTRFRADDMKNLRKSGTEEEYTEREILLQEVSDLEKEWKKKPEKRGAADAEEVRAKAARVASRTNPLMPSTSYADENSLPDLEEETRQTADTPTESETLAEPTETEEPQEEEAQPVTVREEPFMSPNRNGGGRNALIGQYLAQKATATDADRRIRERELALREKDLALRQQEATHRQEMERTEKELEMKKLDLEAAERERQREESQRSRDDLRDLLSQQMLLMKTVLESLKK